MQYEQTKGPVEVYEVETLRFKTPSVIEARAAYRLSLFESLLIDAFGYLCLNTSQSGIVLDLESPKEVQDIYARLPPRTPPPASSSDATRQLQVKVKAFMVAQSKASRKAPTAETELRSVAFRRGLRFRDCFSNAMQQDE